MSDTRACETGGTASGPECVDRRKSPYRWYALWEEKSGLEHDDVLLKDDGRNDAAMWCGMRKMGEQ